MDLRHTPFTTQPVLPWNQETTPNPRVLTSATRATITINTIPTTLLLLKKGNGDAKESTVPLVCLNIYNAIFVLYPNLDDSSRNWKNCGERRDQASQVTRNSKTGNHFN